MAESKSDRQKRTHELISRFKRYYPDAHCALDHSNPLELLLATILSAQCTDERVNQVTKGLFKRYRSAQDFAKAPIGDLEDMVRPTGFFRAKARSLKGTCESLVKDHGGQVPADLNVLVGLPGVGRKTANVVLGNAFGLATGIVVDTHVKRLSFRLGLTRQKSPEKVEDDLLPLVPKEDWIQFSHWLITHGRQVCKARKPTCEVCVIEGLCPKRGV